MDHQAWMNNLREDIRFTEELLGKPYRFRSTWGLFSPRNLDEGSKLLLDHVRIRETDDCLDLGCGYGPIGVVMASRAPRGNTLLVDKDFVAVEYSRKNIRENGLSNCEAILSNGFSHVGDRRFDLIASNIPAKVGKELLLILLGDAYVHLRPGGRIYVVTITGLRRFIQRNLTEVFGNYDKVKQGQHYTVAMAVREI